MMSVLILALVNIAPFICVNAQLLVPSIPPPIQVTDVEERSILLEFPYLVSIQSLDVGHICGGNILNKRWILTAAHCVKNGQRLYDPTELEILAGTLDLSQGGIRYNVEDIVLHPNFEYWVNRNDLALLKVSEDIEFSESVSPIPLVSSYVPPGASVISAGWGKTPEEVSNNPQLVEMYLIDTVTCIYNYPNLEIFNNNVCAQTKILGEGTCSGDSGGPLVYNGELVGVLSWGTACGGPYPEVYSRVESFMDWILVNINE